MLDKVHFCGGYKIAEYLCINSIARACTSDPVIADKLDVVWERKVLTAANVHIAGVNIIAVLINTASGTKVGLYQIKHRNTCLLCKNEIKITNKAAPKTVFSPVFIQDFTAACFVVV